MIINPSQNQLNIIRSPIDSRTYLEGPAGTGKSTAGILRILHIIDKGIAPESILLIIPQRTLAVPYYEALRKKDIPFGGIVSIHTISSLAQTMVETFWPVIGKKAGFHRPEKFPVFLTLETAQYYMSLIIKPLFEKGYFQTITIDRHRIYSQILDNLNKAALVGFPCTSIGEILKNSWIGDPLQARIYEECQICANLFREYCLANNLLDFSLKIEIFIKHIWTEPLCRQYLINRYTNIIIDNIEEDSPVTHDILKEWLPHVSSALLITDHEAGYRSFLGADPKNALTLKNLFNIHAIFNDSFVTSTDLRYFISNMSRVLNRPYSKEEKGHVRNILNFEYHRYHTQMLDRVSEEVFGLLNEGVQPEEVVILAPFLTDALRFSLINRLETKGVTVRTHRPSRPLRDEPGTKCLLTLSALAHPSWKIIPDPSDIAYALTDSIDELDLVRAQLIAGKLYTVKDGMALLLSFDSIPSEFQERITYFLGEKYEKLRLWIDHYIKGPQIELDLFLSHLFGEILSQKSYRFHVNLNNGEITANLIDSVKKFRKIIKSAILRPDTSIGKEYMEMVREGLVADQYMRSWKFQEKKAVLIAPAYTFLMSNCPVDYQFWLNVGSMGWWERIYQPLTHPYVLSRQWQKNTQWTDLHEFEARQDALYRLIIGLIRRCRKKIYLGFSELGEQGYEQHGPLLRAIQQVLRGAD